MKPKLATYRNLVIESRSTRPMPDLRRLIRFAWHQVYRVARRERWLDKFQRTTFLQISDCREIFAGEFKCEKPLCFITLRIGPDSAFPGDGTCAGPGLVNVVEVALNDWREGFARLVAHELAHHRYDGRVEGEFHCELVAVDCLDAYRKQH